ncbi:hypothetical protein V8G54_012134 [Vigna mungo]|uniref:Uncharacterized protein n=1 Tax=Vigna mungo TaxID=3915 RepID=A0AAQ3S329_VIGMU
MGNNNVACFLRLRWSLPFPSHIQMGTDATINMKTISRRTSDGLHVENAEVLYTVEGSKCKLELGRIIIYDGNVNVLTFRLQDICSGKGKLSLVIFKKGTGLFDVHEWCEWTKTRRSVDAWGGVTDTKVYLYGTANSETTDIGYSVVTKVGVCDGKFDITVEGPEPHPVSALLHAEISLLLLREDNNDVPLPPRVDSQQNARFQISDFEEIKPHESYISTIS